MKTSRAAELSVPIEAVIHTLRGERVILDADLAAVYGVETRVLNQAVKRNMEKFPDDFIFRLTRREAREIAGSRSQSVILKRGQNIKYLPYAFTEHGAIMAANVLNSPRAVQMSVFVVRAFVRLRQMVVSHKEMVAKLAEVERKVASHDTHIRTLFEAIRRSWPRPSPRSAESAFWCGKGPRATEEGNGRSLRHFDNCRNVEMVPDSRHQPRSQPLRFALDDPRKSALF